MRVNLLILITLLVTMCTSKVVVPEIAYANAPLILYKTKADYSQYIPITLNNERNKIIAYPGIKDIYNNKEFAVPTKLKNGYLLDNLGISPLSAYTSITFQEYASFKTPPSVDYLMEHIIDKNPFLEVYNCGVRNSNLEIKTLNNIIAKKFENCELLNNK